ncbi:fractalkine-like isoform X2 [Neoarius graeffei]|nr:fractalkine-like isoform X2 [Neoarius graeffei]
MRIIKGYRETRTDCTYRGVIFSLFKGRRVCGNPSHMWVQQAMKKIDQRQFKKSTLLDFTEERQHKKISDAKAAKECCYGFPKVAIPMRIIKSYRETRTDCTYRGVIFSLFKGRRACANPSHMWVQQAMKKIDQRQFKKSTLLDFTEERQHKEISDTISAPQHDFTDEERNTEFSATSSAPQQDFTEGQQQQKEISATSSAPQKDFTERQQQKEIAATSSAPQQVSTEGQQKEISASSMKTWCLKVGEEELKCPAQSPDLNPTEQLCDELEH